MLVFFNIVPHHGMSFRKSVPHIWQVSKMISVLSKIKFLLCLWYYAEACRQRFFLRHFEEPKRSLKISKFLWKQLIIAVSFTDLKIGGLLILRDGSSSQTLKKTLRVRTGAA